MQSRAVILFCVLFAFYILITEVYLKLLKVECGHLPLNTLCVFVCACTCEGERGGKRTDDGQ